MFSWLKKLFSKEEEIPIEMKYLIVGLGNMHPDYDSTRHNIGFEAVDLMAQEFDATWKNDKLGDLTQVKFKGRTIYLLKPSTYMNRSGKAVQYWMTKHNILKQNILIVVDDLNLDFGKIRLRDKGSDGGHNGLKDINNHLGSKYARLRLGIGDDFKKGQQVDFVLGKWTKKELEGLEELLHRSVDVCKNFCSIGFKFTRDKIKN